MNDSASSKFHESTLLFVCLLFCPRLGGKGRVGRKEVDPRRGQMILWRRGLWTGNIKIRQPIHFLCPEAAGGEGRVF